MSGLEIAKKVGLEFCPCEIVSETAICEISLDNIQEYLQQKFENPRAVFVAWQIQNIVWGTFDGKKLSARSDITPQFWLECRIFNADEELHLKRIDNELRGRYITETKGDKNFYADSFSRFWGENFGAADGFIKLLDKQRKLFMEIPCENKNAKWYGLLTRNYISSHETTGLCGYTDYRFVSIEPAEEGIKNG